MMLELVVSDSPLVVVVIFVSDMHQFNWETAQKKFCSLFRFIFLWLWHIFYVVLVLFFFYKKIKNF